MSRGHEIATILFEKAWNDGDYDDLKLVFAPGCVFQTSEGPAQYGVREQIELIEGYKESFSDVYFEIRHVVGDGDLVAMHIRMTGTQSGEYEGHPGTGRSIDVGEMLFMRLVDGKVAEIWGIFDTYREHRQLGFV